jgi:peptide/nickel transport system substrate-binding protein
VVVLLAGACSSTSSESTDTTAGPGAQESVDRDGTLKLGFDLTQNGQFSWEPGANTAYGSLDPLWYLVYGRLMRATADGTFVPDLAESVTVVDPNTIDIVVRPDQTWQDGAPFDAASVKAGLDHNLQSDPARSAFPEAFYKVTSVDVVDPVTVRLKFDNGSAASWYDTFITAAQTTITRPGTYEGAPIGAGPMKVTAYTPDSVLTMERYDGFWNAEEVGFAGIDIVQVANGQAQAATAALQAGQANIVTFDTTQLSALSGALEPAILSDPSRLMRVGMCRRDTPLDNADVRRAISNAIDREALNDAVFEGTAEPAVQLWPEGNRFFNPEVGDELDYDPETAKQLIADSGLTDPTFDLYVLDNLGLPDTAVVLEQQLAAVGITANITVTPDLVGQFLTPQTPGATVFPATSNPGLLKLKDFNGTATSNLCGWHDQRIQDLFDQISKVSTDTEEAQQAWWELEEIYADQTLGVPLLFASVVGGYDSDRLVLGELYPGGLAVVPDIYTSRIAG